MRRIAVTIVAWAALLGLGCRGEASGAADAGSPRDSGAEAPDAGDVQSDAPAVCQRLEPCCLRHTNPEFIPSCQAEARSGTAAGCERESRSSDRVKRCVGGAEREACARLTRVCCPRLSSAEIQQDCARHGSSNDPAECAEMLAAYTPCADLEYPPDAGP